MINRTLAPPVSFHLDLPKLSNQPIQLLGFLPCYCLEGGAEDVLKIDVVFRAGMYYEDLPLLANTTLGMLKEGSAKYSGKEIAEKVDFYGAQLQTDISNDRVEVSLVTQGKHLDALRDVFTDVLIQPTFPDKEYLRHVSRSKSQLAVNLEKVQFGCRLLSSELIFGDHPYRERVSIDGYDALSPEMLRAFHQKHYGLAQAYLVISGKGCVAAAEKIAESIGAKHKSIAADQPIESRADWNYSPQEKRIHRKGALQSAIRMGAPVIGRDHPDYVSLYMANMALGGYFGSKLMQNIREDKGYTYGIGSSVNVLEKASYIMISTQVGAEVTDATLREILFEMDEMRHAALETGELERIKRYVLGNLLESFDGPFAMSDRLKIALNHNLNADYFQSFGDRILKTTPADVQAAAQEYFDAGQFTTAVVGSWDA